MSRDKYEILAMAREAGAVFDPQWGIASNTGTATFERFATLCRAPLVAEIAALKQAHEINADTLNAMQVEIDDWKARAEAAELARVQAVAEWQGSADGGKSWRRIDKPRGESIESRVAYLRNMTNSQGRPIYLIRALYTTPQPAAQRFATLCRAPLVAEVERLEQWHAEMADNRNAIASERDTLKAELARVRAVEPFGWYSAKEDDFMLDKIRKTHERLNSHTHRIGKYDLALYTTPPQPAAQELDCATTGVCVRSGLYASPPGAVPVVEQLVEALKSANGRHSLVCHLHDFGSKCTCGLDEKTTAALAAGQQYLKENGK